MNLPETTWHDEEQPGIPDIFSHSKHQEGPSQAHLLERTRTSSWLAVKLKQRHDCNTVLLLPSYRRWSKVKLGECRRLVFILWDQTDHGIHSYCCLACFNMYVRQIMRGWCESKGMHLKLERKKNNKKARCFYVLTEVFRLVLWSGGQMHKGGKSITFRVDFIMWDIISMRKVHIRLFIL